MWIVSPTPGLSEMPLPQLCDLQHNFSGLYCCNMRVKLNDTKSHFEFKIYGCMNLNYIWVTDTTSCSNKCQCLPVFSKMYIKAQNISSKKNLPMWRADIFPLCPGVFSDYLVPRAGHLRFILRESVEMF